MGGVPFTEFRETKYFAPLDGLRAVSILLVVSLHANDRIWRIINGRLGVTIFFVISGWLITTLLLREESRRDRVDLRAFLLRRVFRLWPVYLVALGLYVLVIGVIGMNWGRSAFLAALPWYLTHQADFAPTSIFGHAWSLSIEEKFYVVWPVLAFAALLLRRVRPYTVAVLIALTLAAELPGSGPTIGYFATYTPLLMGCALAMLMHTERGYRLVTPLMHPVVTVILVAIGMVVLAFNNDAGHVHTFFGFITVLALPGFVSGAAWIRRLLTLGPLVYIGKRSYALYLIHPLMIAVVNLWVAAGSRSHKVEVLHLTLILIVSIAAAAILHLLVEQPMIRLGHRLIHRRVRPSTTPTAAATTPPHHGWLPTQPAVGRHRAPAEAEATWSALPQETSAGGSSA
jgi:peptidoglycan/LPS O-acetylase OafA/YrhL